MAIIIQNDGDRVVDTIAQRNSIGVEKRFPGMQVSVKDATGDPQTNGGFAKYEWIKDGANSRWALIQKDYQFTLSFATETKVITEGIVLTDNVPSNGSIWSVKLIDSVSGIILGDYNAVSVGGYTIDMGTNDYDGQLLEYTYAYGSFGAQLDTVLNDIKSKSYLLTDNNIDLLLGDLFTKTITTDTTFSVSNVEVAGIVDSFILELTDAGSFVITWFSNIQWDSGTAPTLTAGGKDTIAFYTYDGGVTWNGVVIGLDVKPVA